MCGAVIRRPIARELFGCVKIEDIALSLLAELRLDSQHLCAPSLIDRRLRVVVWSTHNCTRSSSEVERRESSPRYPCSASIKVCCCVVRNKIIIDHWFACIASALVCFYVRVDDDFVALRLEFPHAENSSTRRHCLANICHLFASLVDALFHTESICMTKMGSSNVRLIESKFLCAKKKSFSFWNMLFWLECRSDEAQPWQK